mgnify:CR=1 FL=1
MTVCLLFIVFWRVWIGVKIGVKIGVWIGVKIGVNSQVSQTVPNRSIPHKHWGCQFFES